MKDRILKCGNEEYRKLEAELKSIQNVFKKRGKEFRKAVSTIENIGSSDYEIRQALLYRENYLKMFEQFKNSEYYDAIVKKIKSYENPLTFYNKIKSLSYGEYLADIKYMYDSKQAELILGQMAEELGIEVQDIDIEEGE